MAIDKAVDSTELNSGLTSVANAIRTKGGTSAQLSFPSGMVTAIGNIQTGITPSGTKSITSNGTHDVTEFASAAVNVTKGDNWKQFDVTIATEIPAWENNPIIITADPDVASHYADQTARLYMTYKGAGLPQALNYALVFSTNANSVIYIVSGTNYYSTSNRMSTSGAIKTLYSTFPMSADKSETASRYGLWVDRSGNIGLMTLGLAPGDYSIFFTW